MVEVHPVMQDLLNRFVTWAEGQPDVRAAAVIGSQARQDRPADEWSDLDILIVVSDLGAFVSDTSWLKNIGAVWLSFMEGTPSGEGVERRVLFEGGLDVDFAPVSLQDVERMLHGPQPPELQSILRRGVSFVVDKDGIEARVGTSSVPQTVLHPPSEQEFLNLVNDFWYHAVWTAKKLRRGELWMSLLALDSYIKARLLLPMIEWHARSLHGWDYDTWHSGRFLEKWADARVVSGLHGAFAHYEPTAAGRALIANMDLFRWLSVETAERLGYSYPHEGAAHATQWVTTCLEQLK